MDLLNSTIGRALWSERQLFEVMVDFWSNHLNVTCPTETSGTTGTCYDRDVIRAHTFGKYKNMLLGLGQAPRDARRTSTRLSRRSTPQRELRPRAARAPQRRRRRAGTTRTRSTRLLDCSRVVAAHQPRRPERRRRPSWTRERVRLRVQTIHDAIRRAGARLPVVDAHARTRAWLASTPTSPTWRSIARPRNGSPTSWRSGSSPTSRRSRWCRRLAERLSGERHRDRARASGAVHVP